jgi:hypothetical protein
MIHPFVELISDVSIVLLGLNVVVVVVVILIVVAIVDELLLLLLLHYDSLLGGIDNLLP